MPCYLKQSGNLSMWQPHTNTDHGVSLILKSLSHDFKIRAHPFPSKWNKSNRDQRSVFVFVSMCQTHTIKDVCMWSLDCDDIADVFFMLLHSDTASSEAGAKICTSIYIFLFSESSAWSEWECWPPLGP